MASGARHRPPSEPGGGNAPGRVSISVPRRLLVALVLTALPVALWALLPMPTAGQGRVGRLQTRIDRAQGQINHKRGRERVLSSDIASYSARIGALESQVDRLTRRQDALQADLDTKKAELNRLQDQLRRQRVWVAALRAKLAENRLTLARRLREIYTAERPDIVTVVLSSNGFAELLERGEFLRRINRQDAQVIHRVRRISEDADRAEKRLTGLEARQEAVTAEVFARRNEVDSVRREVAGARDAYRAVRARKREVLESTRDARLELEEDVRAMMEEQAQIRGDLAAGTALAGPLRRGSGGLIWPVNGPITSPFCEPRSWESCHPGIDIGAGSGTPIMAADSGTVALASSYGGYGNYTCITHGGGLSTCYAHQSSFAVGAGQSVSQGQVIGYVGCTGRCYGAHLHFEVRVGGGVVDPLGYL
jgi:murein DD-endopeptidase MepM/ murein hydrolase activator NlpD